jgi:hypothetical protein
LDGTFFAQNDAKDRDLAQKSSFFDGFCLLIGTQAYLFKLLILDRLIEKHLLENRGFQREGVGISVQIQARSAVDQQTGGLACIYYALPEGYFRQERLRQIYLRGFSSWMPAEPRSAGARCN